MTIKNFIILLVGAFLISSCTKNIDFDLNEDQQRIVVDGFITNAKKKHLIRITKSTSFFEKEAAPKAENANVEISDGTNSWSCIEENPGEYFTPDVAFPNEKKYTLTIDFEGTTYSASDYMNSVIELDTIITFEEEDFDFENGGKKPFVNIAMFGTEDKGLGDYYLWKYQVKKPDTAYKDMTPTYRDWSWASDEFVDGRSPKEGWPIFTGIETEEIVPGSTVRFQMFGISKAYYEFLDALGKQVFRGGLFDGPPANIPSNFNNGALGFFTTASEREATTVKD